MTPQAVYQILCGYIAGLLAAPYLPWPWGMVWLGGGWLVSAAIAIVAPRHRRSHTWVWVGIAAFLGGIYFHLRQPLPAANDISHFVATLPRSATVQIQGTLQERPQLNRSGKVRFRLAAEQLTVPSSETASPPVQDVTGSLYVTLPRLHGTGLGAGDRVEINGRLYQPSAPTNPGQFDFQRFLARQGIWAGLTGESVNWETVVDRPNWLEMVRDRVVQAHVAGLGAPSGLLMSAMTLGRWSVDLPYDLRDRLSELGLAHALAASGFHVGIILKSVLDWVGRSPRGQFGAGSVTLVLYAALAGFQPSVCRAAFMGWATVLGGVVQRRVRSSGTLLAIAALLLLWNPLLVQDLGFQLSFLATFGLIVTTEPIAQLLGFVPSWLAASLAVPIAATLWTLPLQIYIFNVISPAAIPINLAVGELLGLVTTVGFTSGLVAVVFPLGGSILARGLAYPLHWTISALNWVHDQVGRVWFVRQIEVWQVAALYAVLFGLWLWRSRAILDSDNPTDATFDGDRGDSNAGTESPHRSRRVLAIVGCAIAGGGLCVAIALLPGWLQHRGGSYVYVLDAAREPVIFVRNATTTLLLGNGTTPETSQFAILPLFRALGVNQLTAAVEPRPAVEDVEGVTDVANAADRTLRLDSTWTTITEQMAIASVFRSPLPEPSATLIAPDLSLRSLGATGNLLLNVGDHRWLVLYDESDAAIAALPAALAEASPNVICWSGRALDGLAALDETLEAAIAIDRIDPELRQHLQARGIPIWETRQGAIVLDQHNTVQRAIDSRQWL